METFAIIISALALAVAIATVSYTVIRATTLPRKGPAPTTISMATEYIVTYKKKAYSEGPHGSVQFATHSLERAMQRYNGMLEWNKRVPEIELKDLKLTERTYTDKDITP